MVVFINYYYKLTRNL